MGSKFRYCLIFANIFQHIENRCYRFVTRIMILNATTIIPIEHQEEDAACNEYRDPTAMSKLKHIGNKESCFNTDKEERKRNTDPHRITFEIKINEKQQGSHQHGNGDRQTIGGFHIR